MVEIESVEDDAYFLICDIRLSEIDKHMYVQDEMTVTRLLYIVHENCLKAPSSNLPTLYIVHENCLKAPSSNLPTLAPQTRTWIDFAGTDPLNAFDRDCEQE